MKAERSAGAAWLAAALLLFSCSRSEPPPAPTVARTPPPPVIAPAAKPSPAFLRDHYAQLADCVDDWGAAQKCTPAPAALESAGVRFLGPIYAKGFREETQAQLRREAVEQGYAPQASTEPSNRARASVEVRP
jgi:hypothetical protein